MSATITNIADRIARQDRRNLYQERQDRLRLHSLGFALLFGAGAWVVLYALVMGFSR